MIVYIWSRRNPHFRISILGLVTIQAPYQPFVLLAIFFLTGHSIAVDLLGIFAGHVYYFLEDIFPHRPGALFDPTEDDPDYNPPPEERPGGFDWGNNQGVQDEQQVE
ncbi:Derlin [Caligus rogercresseyi]|uniref:Derlin n=1 Tax=Caligus rogercresseyi TaxID=217165 RepID=A0A7T8HJ08_CALRO|nr:Derlin [Caligus rogercresseyi]